MMFQKVIDDGEPGPPAAPGPSELAKKLEEDGADEKARASRADDEEPDEGSDDDDGA
jgi:ribosomal protein L12E/L44/L45/RPP1/RPP2